MKNKNAFTLVELLGVIMILALIVIVASPSIIERIKESEVEIDKASLALIESATDMYIDENYNTYPNINGNTYCISLQQLVDSGKLKEPILNIKSDEEIDLNTLVEVKVINNNMNIIINNDCIEFIYAFNEAKGVNSPQLATGMKPILWNETENRWDEIEEYDSRWYDYSEQKWANAQTKDGSFWVWIPRYAYKVTSGYNSGTTGEIDIKFLKDTTTTPADDTIIETSGYNPGTKDTSTGYFLHPAFNNDSELGFWVAKFEPSVANQTHECYISGTGCNNSNLTLAVIPNAKSWTSIDVKNEYQASVSIKGKGDIYGWLSNEVDTHMMKNIEWGAVAYLSHSNYGKYGNLIYTGATGLEEEIYINNINTYLETGSGPSITGCAGDAVSAGMLKSATCPETNQYHTPQGEKASTTGNIYGIYDMSGGAWERVMAVYNNLTASSGFTTEELATIPLNHIDGYTTETMLNGVGMDYDPSLYGDAVYETSYNAYRYNGTSWSGTASGSWYSDNSYLPYVSGPWLIRGGAYDGGFYAGAFSFIYSNGSANSSVSFRPVTFVLNR